MAEQQTGRGDSAGLLAVTTQNSVRFTRAARVAEVPEGTTNLVRVEGRLVLLANWQGSIYGFEAICPHQRNPLEGAKLWNGALECPWHHFRYDLATGANVYPANVYPQDDPRLQEQLRPVGTYLIDIRDGEIFVGLCDA